MLNLTCFICKQTEMWNLKLFLDEQCIHLLILWPSLTSVRNYQFFTLWQWNIHFTLYSTLLSSNVFPSTTSVLFSWWLSHLWASWFIWTQRILQIVRYILMNTLAVESDDPQHTAQTVSSSACRQDTLSHSPNSSRQPACRLGVMLGHRG